MDYQVIVGTPYWAVNGVNVFSANLVRGINAGGGNARILLTERQSTLVRAPEPMMEFPGDVPADDLPLRSRECWGAHWGAMIRYLEERAPCIYIPNHDWRHSTVSSRLSGAVRIVGIVHSDDPLHYDHVARLGRYWDAIVGTSEAISRQVVLRNSGLAPRVATIPIGVPVPVQLPAKQPLAGRPLRLVYQGGLIQYQKRVFDLPKIVEEASRLGIPVELTLIGDGTERDALMAACRCHVEKGTIRFLGVLPHSQVLSMLDQFDVFLLTSEFEGMPNALGEAMARGCVPVVTEIRSGIRELVRDGDSGCVVPVGDIAAFARRLALLYGDPHLLGQMSARARDRVIHAGHSVDEMVRRYLALFDGLFQPERLPFRRPRGVLRLPPYQVKKVKLLEVKAPRLFDGVGVFCSPSVDYQAYSRELQDVPGHEVPALRSRMSRAYPNVVVSLTSGRLSGVDVFSVNLVRGLRALGREANLLMTCPDDATPDPLEVPKGLPLKRLRVSRRMAWPERWKRVAGYLERSSPCIYVPNYDWRNSCISPTLSSRVGIVGIVHSDDPVHYEHVGRLGPYWNAIVAVSDTIARRVVELNPDLAPRLVTIPYGVDVPAAAPVRVPDPRDRLRIVYAGRLEGNQKRVQDLPKIFSALRERGVPAELTIIGGGVEDAALRAGCRQWIGDGTVRFLGTLPNADVLTEFARNDVFVLTSEFEGLPVSLLEAMANGCIPVVTDIPSGIPEVVREGETGYRVPVGGITAFVDRLALLQSNPSRRKSMSQACHQAILTGEYGIGDMVASYMNLFERVLVEAELGEFQRPAGEVLPPPNAAWLVRRSFRDRVKGLLSRVASSARRTTGAGS